MKQIFVVMSLKNNEAKGTGTNAESMEARRRAADQENGRFSKQRKILVTKEKKE